MIKGTKIIDNPKAIGIAQTLLDSRKFTSEADITLLTNTLAIAQDIYTLYPELPPPKKIFDEDIIIELEWCNMGYELTVIVCGDMVHYLVRRFKGVNRYSTWGYEAFSLDLPQVFQDYLKLYVEYDLTR